jgi:hypothetical protein
MDVKISQEKLDNLEDIVFDYLSIEHDGWKSPFSKRFGYILLFTFYSPREIAAKYDDDYSSITVYDDKFYGMVDSYVNRKVYNLIKENLIRRIFKVYTQKYKSIYSREPKNVTFL